MSEKLRKETRASKFFRRGGEKNTFFLFVFLGDSFKKLFLKKLERRRRDSLVSTAVIRN